MPADLREGLYLTGVGMGVVFFALSGLLLVVVALQRLFPGKETPPSSQGGEAPGQELEAREKHTPTELPQPLQATSSQSYGGETGAQIAAIAAAAYLSMEQEGQPETARREVPKPPVSQPSSTWGTRARMTLMESQSRRPPPYGRKPRQG